MDSEGYSLLGWGRWTGGYKTHSKALDVIGVMHAKIIFWKLGRVQPIACVDMAKALENGMEGPIFITSEISGELVDDCRVDNLLCDKSFQLIGDVLGC
jgi:hypothetical protein